MRPASSHSSVATVWTPEGDRRVLAVHDGAPTTVAASSELAVECSPQAITVGADAAVDRVPSGIPAGSGGEVWHDVAGRWNRAGRRWLTRVGVALGVLFSGTVVYDVTEAAFTGYTTNPGSTFGSGSWSTGPQVITSTTGVPATSMEYVDVAKPTGVQNNDVLIAAVALNYSHVTFTPPSGWSVVASKNDVGNSLAVYYKVISNAAGEPATYRFTNNVWDPSIGAISLIRGANTATPIDGIPTTGSGASAGPIAGSFTTTGANRLVLAIAATAANGSATPPTGMTEDYDRAMAGNGCPAGLTSASLAQPTAGATGNKTFTYSLSSNWTTALVAVR
jgi:hypothetical protein